MSLGITNCCTRPEGDQLGIKARSSPGYSKKQKNHEKERQSILSLVQANIYVEIVEMYDLERKKFTNVLLLDYLHELIKKSYISGRN